MKELLVKSALVTGCAGFIGMNLALALLRDGWQVVGIDSLTDYYDVKLKHARLAELKRSQDFRFTEESIADRRALDRIFETQRFDIVLNLAGQAGVRQSFNDPHAYTESNLVGFVNIIEASRRAKVKGLIYASSSSVYGNSSSPPFDEEGNVNEPLNIYAATKRSNELVAFSYWNLFGFRSLGLRFFTVYGPWGRPDMAIYDFTRRIIAGQPITLRNSGNMRRAFTYIDDVSDAVLALVRLMAQDQAADDPLRVVGGGATPCRVVNVGSSSSCTLRELVSVLEVVCGKRADLCLATDCQGESIETAASSRRLAELTGVRLDTPLAEGIRKFYGWYARYHNISA